jgi:Zn-dependent protease
MAGISLFSPTNHAIVIYISRGSLFQGVSSGLQAVILLCLLAIRINLSLLIFNLLPIPPLDGSHLLRNMLPYNAVQTYDRIPLWVSYLLMMVVGGTVIWLFLAPALALVTWALIHV